MIRSSFDRLLRSALPRAGHGSSEPGTRVCGESRHDTRARSGGGHPAPGALRARGRTRRGRCRVASLALLTCLAVSGAAEERKGVYSHPACYRLDAPHAVAPLDWRDRSASTNKYRKLVLDFHFKPEHQRGAIAGDIRAGVWDNLDYTLRWFPNFPRGLFLLGVFEAQVQRSNPNYVRKLVNEDGLSPLTCYFERAVRLMPDDPAVFNALGIMLIRRDRTDEAIDAFRKAVSLAPESPEAHYNLGLAYFSARDYEKSADAARNAYRLGYKKQGLMIRLKRKGHWK